MRRFRSLLTLSLLAVTMLALAGCNAQEPVDPAPAPTPDTTPTENTYAEVLHGEYREVIPDTLPHATVTESGSDSAGLVLTLHEDTLLEESHEHRVAVLRTNMDVGTAYVDVDDAYAADLEGGSCFFNLVGFIPMTGVTLTVTYTDMNGAQQQSSVAIPRVAQKQRVPVRMDNVSFCGGVDGHDLSIRVSALDEGLYVRFCDVLLTDAGKELPALGSAILIPPAYARNADYGSYANVVAEASVTQFGAVGDGRMDDTAAFESALSYVASLGGGTVYVPVGRYVLTRPIEMPDSVALVGQIDLHSLNTTGQLRGSVLMCYPDKTSDAPMFLLNNYSTLQSLAFWYPEQTLQDGQVIEYPYTIAGRTSSTLYGSNLENLVLVNSYRGIRFGNEYNVLEVLRNVYGTPLEVGFMIGGNADIARVEGMCFSTYYWSHSGLPFTPDEQDILAVTRTRGTGAIVERVDWTYMFDMAFDGYRTGLLFRYTSDGIHEGSANGSLYRLDITNCRFGIEVQAAHEIGLMLTDSHITAGGYSDAVAVLLNNKTATAFSIMDCTLESEGSHVVYNAGNASLNISNSTLAYVGTPSPSRGALVHCAAGSVSLVACKLPAQSSVEQPYDHLFLGKTVAQASAINCGALTVAGEGKDVLLCEQDDALVLTPVPAVDVNGDTRRYYPSYGNFPAPEQRLIDLSAEPYLVRDGEDITERLQDAIDALPISGGTVYLPVGTYRVERAITIRSGVELRGAIDASISRITKTTRIVTDFGRGQPDGDALISLESGAGIVGIRIGYDKQDPNNLARYSYALRGLGKDIYIRNVSFDNVWNGLDLASERCDNALVKGITGVAFSNAIIVGGGSKSCIVRDVLTNPAYWKIDETMDDANDQLIFIHVKDCSDLVLYSNFHYAGRIGLLLDGDIDDLTVIAHGTDYGNRVICGRDGHIDATLINTQMAAFAPGERIFVDITSDVSGTLSLIGISGWGSPQRAVRCESGSVFVRGGNLIAWGTPTAELLYSKNYTPSVSICAVSFTGMSGHPIASVADGKLQICGTLTPAPWKIEHGADGEIIGTDIH